MKSQIELQVKVADEVWIAAALLQREQPGTDFSIEEIVERARNEGLHTTLRPGVYVHVVQHCVANRPPNPGRYRMLFETAPGRRRLYRQGDASDPGREGSKITPDAADIPAAYVDLLEWYRDWSDKAGSDEIEKDPLLTALGSGKKIWSEEGADEYVRSLREGWQ